MSSSHLNNSKLSSPTCSSTQIQTTATVHSQHQKPGPQAAAPNQSQNQRTVKSSIGGVGGVIIPPKYQPPPQPLSGGILKHLSTATPKQYYSANYFVGDLATPDELNIKYPPDIPKLSTIYIPEAHSDKNHHHLRRQPLQRISSGGQQYVLAEDNHNMLKFVRKADQEQHGSNIPAPGGGSVVAGRLTSEQNRHLQSLLSDLRSLKEANQRLNDDNQELRDLCCFLDDDRQKGRKLAREWQRFGRYTASVMRQEVSAYQNKLRQLDDKQQELIRDNLELKELCLYLDEERAHVASNSLCSNCGSTTRPLSAALNRDDGDGSSYSTNADETLPTMRNFDRQLPELNMRSSLSDQTLQYVRSLEQRIHQLEEERISGSNNQDLTDPLSGRPEAVVRALQVLEVREQLEREAIATDQQIEQMDDGEKALVREMCNVIWRKLEESPNGPNMEE